ncbi:MFS transporter [Kutzneria chonburiensis]|uniref:MFS transporter n=1 Tax=Kutzneria chonburiensis TaxID=1483604 RepID=A0ABV6N5J1_9PSEU|nr:MFS transporter [Kutzneria chonburiensis]
MADVSRIRLVAVYAGATIGPLAGGLVAPMLPELSQSLHTSVTDAAGSVTVYFIPFALLQLVSGTLGERWGVRRTVRAAYLVFVVASLGCMVAPNLEIFLAGRAVLGAANAFTSPLLLASLGDLVPRERLGRAVGLYASCMSGGQSFSPLIGGLAAGIDWRLGFAVVAVVSVALAFVPPLGEPRPGTSAPPWRPLLSVRMGLLSTSAVASFLGGAGLPFLVALYAHDFLGASPEMAGVSLVGFGLAGLVLGPVWGMVCDRVGARTVGVIGAITGAGLIAAIGLTGALWSLAVCWTVAGAASAMLTVSLQNLTMSAVPGNRAGAVSVVSGFRFAGSALAPAAWLPVYHNGSTIAFALAGSTQLIAAAALVCLRGRHDPAALR